MQTLRQLWLWCDAVAMSSDESYELGLDAACRAFNGDASA
jgi:hypothetical protein